MENLRIGIIGCGYWGPNLIRNIHEISSSELVAVADLNEDRLHSIKSRYHDIITTRNYRDLFDLNLDGILLATPPSTHFAIASDVLNHGINVMVEKPMTTNTKDAEELIELAARKQLVLMVGHTFIYNNALHELKNLMNNDDIGRVHYVDTARLSLGLYQPGLNVLWDLAPHDLSIVFFLLEKNPISIEIFGTACVLKGVQDVVHLNIMYPGNVLAHIHVSWLAPVKVRRVTVVGSKKMVVYNDIEALDKLKIYDKGVEFPEFVDSYTEWQCSYRAGNIVIPNIKFTEPLRLECQHFLDCIANKVPCMTSGEEGLKVVKMLEVSQRILMNEHYGEVLEW